MQHNSVFIQQYRLKAYYAYTICLVIFFVRFISNAMFSQMASPHLFFGEQEWSYRIFSNSGIIPYIVSHHVLSGLLDGMLFFIPMVFLLTTNRIFAIAYTLLATIYFLTYNIVTGHHYHGLVGLLVISIPFWSQNEQRFNFLWQGARYYLLYIFFSAACWKILRGSVFDVNQMSNILKDQQVILLYQHPETWKAAWVSYLIAHPYVSHLLLLANVVVQLSFGIGFLSRRFDTLIFFIAILFVVANYFIMGIVSAELLVLTLTLWNWEKVETMTYKILARYSSVPATA